MGRHSVALHQLRDGVISRKSFAALPDAEVHRPDGDWIVEVELEADDFEHALHRVWNAIAAAGADDCFHFAEHPDMPEHWRRVAGGPGTPEMPAG